MAIEPAAISARPAVTMMPVEATAPERPAASANGTVRPSDIPMTMSRTASLAVECCSMCGVCGTTRSLCLGRDATRRSLGPPAPGLHGAARHREPERLPEARSIEATQPLACVGGSSDPGEKPPVAGIAEPLVEVPVHERRPEKPRKALVHGTLVVVERAREQRPRGHVPGDQREADSETPERILEARSLAGVECRAPPRDGSRTDVSGASEGGRGAHPQSGAALEELARSLPVLTGVGVVVEDAGRDGSPSTTHQQIRVAFGRQPLRERRENAVRHVGLEDGADIERVAAPRAPRPDSAVPQIFRSFTEEDPRAGLDSLALEALVQRALARSPAHEVEGGTAGTDTPFPSFGVEEEPLPNRHGVEGRLDPDLGELLED